MLVSLFSVAQDYKITGTVSADYNDKPVYLINKNGGGTIARSTVVDGKFCFAGSLADQAVLDVVVNRIKGLAATVLVGEGADAFVNMTVRPVAISDNGGLNDKLVEMYANVVKVSREVNALGAQLREEGKIKPLYKQSGKEPLHLKLTANCTYLILAESCMAKPNS